MVKMKRYLPVILDEPHWKLLNMYLVVLNYAAVKCGRRRAGVARIVAAIVGKWLDICADYIRTEFWRISLEVKKESLEGFFSYETLVAIHNATGAEGSELVLFGKRGPNGTRRSKRAQQKEAKRTLERTLRGAAWRTPGVVLRNAGGPVALRGWGAGANPAAGDGPTAELRALVNGAELAGPSHAGLGETEAQTHWWNSLRRAAE